METEKSKAKESLIIVGEWIARETRKRKYKEDELKKISSSLIYLIYYLKGV